MLKVRPQFLPGTKPPSPFTIGSDEDDNQIPRWNHQTLQETTCSCAAQCDHAMYAKGFFLRATAFSTPVPTEETQQFTIHSSQTVECSTSI